MKHMFYLPYIMVSMVVFTMANLAHMNINNIEPKWGTWIIPELMGIVFGLTIAKLVEEHKKLIKSREELLRKKEKINEFIGTVVHDLKNPCSAILNISEMIQNGDIKPHEQQEFVQCIYDASESMKNQLEELVESVRIENGVLKLNLLEGFPQEEISPTVKIFEATAARKNINLSSYVCVQNPKILFDPIAFRDALSNLISNAIKYSPKNSTIKIYSEVEANQFFKVFVEDEGQGLSEEDKKKAFGQFQRLSSRPTNGESSSGLGLYNVKTFVEAMKGIVGVDSKGKNQGSKFWMAFPIQAG